MASLADGHAVASLCETLIFGSGRKASCGFVHSQRRGFTLKSLFIRDDIITDFSLKASSVLEY